MSETDPGAPPREDALARVFVAFTLAEARRAEALLTAQGLAYAVEVEAIGRTLFGSTRQGVVFAVAPEDVEQCTSIVTRAGLDVSLIDDD
jgi:selenophosphate synthetase-related protein